jgi:flagellar assembly protein FliH
LSRLFRAQRKAPRTVQVTKRHKGEVPQDPALVLQDAERRAAEILAAAEKKATSLAESAAADRARLREEASKAGYSEGYKAGLQQASDLLRDAGQALASAREAFDRMKKEAEPRLLALALDTAKRVTSEALAVSPDILLDMVRKGMEALKDEREFSLRVDPALISLVEGASDDLGRQFAARSIEVVPDDSVKNGAVVVTPHGFVDVTLESQIRNIAVALAEARKRALGEEVQ